MVDTNLNYLHEVEEIVEISSTEAVLLVACDICIIALFCDPYVDEAIYRIVVYILWYPYVAESK